MALQTLICKMNKSNHSTGRCIALIISRLLGHCRYIIALVLQSGRRFCRGNSNSKSANENVQLRFSGWRPSTSQCISKHKLWAPADNAHGQSTYQIMYRDSFSFASYSFFWCVFYLFLSAAFGFEKKWIVNGEHVNDLIADGIWRFNIYKFIRHRVHTHTHTYRRWPQKTTKKEQ